MVINSITTVLTPTASLTPNSIDANTVDFANTFANAVNNAVKKETDVFSGQPVASMNPDSKGLIDAALASVPVQMPYGQQSFMSEAQIKASLVNDANMQTTDSNQKWYANGTSKTMLPYDLKDPSTWPSWMSCLTSGEVAGRIAFYNLTPAQQEVHRQVLSSIQGAAAAGEAIPPELQTQYNNIIAMYNSSAPGASENPARQSTAIQAHITDNPSSADTANSVSAGSSPSQAGAVSSSTGDLIFQLQTLINTIRNSETPVMSDELLDSLTGLLANKSG